VTCGKRILNLSMAIGEYFDRVVTTINIPSGWKDLKKVGASEE